MSLSPIRLVLTSIGFFACVFLVNAEETQTRTWTNPDGQTIEAEIIDKNERTVILVLDTGKKCELAINKLSVDDQLFIKSWSKPARRPLNVPEEAVHHDGSWFLVVFEPVSWEEAESEAKRERAHLAWVKNESLNQFLVELAQGRPVWLGGTDAKEEGLWVWGDDEPFDYSNWELFQPDNRFGFEHYLCLSPDGTWVDQNDNPKRMRVAGYVLQWD